MAAAVDLGSSRPRRAGLLVGRSDLDDLAGPLGRRRRGAPRLDRALAWVDGRAESAYEVVLATLHRSADVPVETQFEVLDEHGELVARADLSICGTRRLPEYDGDVHLPRQQQRKDLGRVRRLNALGWDRRGYTRHEVLATPHAVLREADEALGREHDPGRLTAYLQLLRDSCFSAAGKAALAARFAARLP